MRTRYGYGKSPYAFGKFIRADFFRIRIIIKAGAMLQVPN